MVTVCAMAACAQQPAGPGAGVEAAGAAPATSPPRAVIPAGEVPVPHNVVLMDRPNDDGSAALVVFSMAGDEATRIGAEVLVDGQWQKCVLRPQRLDVLDRVGKSPAYFGWSPPNPDDRILTVDRYLTFDEHGELVTNDLAAGHTYSVRLVVHQGAAERSFAVGDVTLHEDWFSTASVNNLVFCVVFALIILGFILAARRNPRLFIRRIQGLEAVDEAIGRATEMGKPVLHINGLDSLATLSTIAAVNILGRIARRVANYDSTLLVPCFDPVVMTVSQEVVKNAYLEAGRPDSYREDHIFFLTDQQFSYTASTCGIMMRERPAAIFLLGMFYAESLMLAETGNSIGAIQIAGTDAQAQLPFFITTCDYTLIGEELYAASAYLSREPMLLGSLKGQDVGKAFVMVIIVVGTLLATIGLFAAQHGFGQHFNWQWLNQLITPLV